MAAETSSPAREPATSTRGRGRGGRGGRGRGRGGGRGASTAALSKSTTASRGRGGTRRGRVKNFSDSRVQAAYERQRDLKATYQAVAFALKPALQELVERNVDEMLQKPDSYKQATEYFPIAQSLKEKLDNKLRECDRRLECDLNLAEHSFNADTYVAEKEFQVRFISFMLFFPAVTSRATLFFFCAGVFYYFFRRCMLTCKNPLCRMVSVILWSNFTRARKIACAFSPLFTPRIYPSM